MVECTCKTTNLMEGILLMSKKKGVRKVYFEREKPEVKPEVKKAPTARVYTDKIVKYCEDLNDPAKRLVFAEGLPHTGKTLNAIEAGILQVTSRKYEKLVIIRPVIIPECGLLKGTLEDKMDTYVRQAREYVNEACVDSFAELCSAGKIEILPADLLQGNHFKDCYVVIDESQNIHYKRTFKTLSRIGDNAKFVIIGDTSMGQEDEKIRHNNLLQYSIRKFEPYNHPSIAVHTFYAEEDILGDEFTKFIIGVLIPDFVAQGSAE